MPLSELHQHVWQRRNQGVMNHAILIRSYHGAQNHRRSIQCDPRCPFEATVMPVQT
jgi:hypothetical protein